MLRTALLAALAAATVITSPVHARDQIRAMGSSTVFPFVAAVAEHYADNTGSKAPIVESIGTGAGFVEFCKGVGEDFSDVANASRLMLASEKEACTKSGVTDIAEIEIGKDGIVIASNANSDAFPLTKKQLFLALAKQVPVGGKLVDNPYTTWKSMALPSLQARVMRLLNWLWNLYAPHCPSSKRPMQIKAPSKKSATHCAKTENILKQAKMITSSCKNFSSMKKRLVSSDTAIWSKISIKSLPIR
jgi:ABC-type phosphate transport system substrate-binding protein